jgi:hypothetical protein
MTYYVSANYGTQPILSDDSEGNSLPVADVIVVIGGGNSSLANMSRSSVLAILESLEQFIRSDATPYGSDLLSQLIQN